MSLQRKSFTNIVSPSSNFKDDVFVVKQNKVAYEQGFSINYIDALSGVNDVKINNYSSLYLTGLKRDTDIFDFNVITDAQNSYITYIKYRDPQEGYFLYFDDTNEYSGGDHSFSFRTSGDFLDVSRTYVEIETIDENLCRIKRRNNDISYYLNYNPTSPYSTKFYFTTAYSSTPVQSNKDVFSYVLDQQGYAIFLKRFGGDTFIVSINTASLTFELQPYTSATNYLLPQTLFGIEFVDNLLEPKTNTSWVSYNQQNLNDIHINDEKSIFNLKNNSIIHFEYNNIENINEIEINDIKLKNQFTNKNVSKRGNANIVTSQNLPAPFFREYSNLVTGNNEEIGYDDIGAGYTFYTQDYNITQGTTIFTTPSSLFPYTQLNINDTSFVRDGALPGLTPVLSDKIFKNVESDDPLTGNYLATWLSGGTGSFGVWLDRYYFPGIVSRQTALSSKAAFTPTFANPVSEIAYDETSLISQQPYYDVMSNFVVLPDETYTYVRPTDAEVGNYVNTFGGVVQYDFNSYVNTTGNTISIDATELSFDGDKVVSIPVSQVNESGTFSLFFEVNGNWKQRTSYIFGSLVDAGFAIYNDERVTSFIYTKSGSNVNTYNIEGTLIYSLSFNSEVLEIISENQLEDYFVTTVSNDVYRVGSDGAVKEQYSIDTTNTPLTGGFTNYLNYWKSGNQIVFLTTDDGEYTSLNVNDGTTSTSTITKFISSDTIFRSIFIKDGVVYGFPGEKIQLKENTLYNLVSGSKIESYDLDITESKTIFTVSNSGIQDFTIDDDGNLYIVHDFNKLTKVSGNRKYISTETFLPGVTGHKIDFVSYFTDTRIIYPVILYTDSSSNAYLLNYTPELSSSPISLPSLNGLNDLFDFGVYNSATAADVPTIQELTGVAQTSSILIDDDGIDDTFTASDVSGSETPDAQALVQAAADNLFSQYISLVKKQTITNYNHYHNNESYKNLNIVLKLKNVYNPLDVDTIAFTTSTDNISDFKNTFLVMYDDKEGVYSIYINSVKVFSQTIDKSKYTFNTLLNNDLILGSLGFYNNLILSEFVNIPGFLYGQNYSVHNFRFYSQRLSDEQINGLFLETAGIDDVFITLPCDQRSNVETMQTIFKLTQPYNKSNSINLVIKNTGITNTSLQSEISAAIVQGIGGVLPGDVNLNTIKFIDY